MTLLKFLSLCVFQSSDIRRNILHKFTETSTSTVRQHCGYLGD